MSSTTGVTDFSDLYTDFIDRLKDSTSDTTLVVKAKRYINTALLDMHINFGDRFLWAHRRGVLITHAPYSTGTVTVSTSARTTVTGSSTLWNTAVTGFGFNNARAGGKMKLASQAEIGVVSSVGSDTSITLTNNYTGDALSGDSYIYYEDEYALASDFLRFIDLHMFSTDLNIPLVGNQEFRKWYGRNDLAGKPKVATQIELAPSGDTSPQHRVVLHPYPNDEYQIPYWYVTSNLAVQSDGTAAQSLSNDADEPIVPRQYRHAIVFHALYHYYRDYKDDARSQEVKAEYVDLMTRIAGETKPGASRPRFEVINRGRPFGRQRFDFGDRFDQLRDR